MTTYVNMHNCARLTLRQARALQILLGLTARAALTNREKRDAMRGEQKLHRAIKAAEKKERIDPG